MLKKGLGLGLILALIAGIVPVSYGNSVLNITDESVVDGNPALLREVVAAMVQYEKAAKMEGKRIKIYNRENKKKERKSSEKKYEKENGNDGSSCDESCAWFSIVRSGWIE